MPINLIIQQPKINYLMAAYRLIILKVDVPILLNPRYFTVSVGIDGNAVIIIDDTSIFDGASTITFGNAGALNGTYNIFALVFSGNTVTIQRAPSGTPFPAGIYPKATIAINGTLTLNPGLKYAPVVYCDIYFNGVYYKSQSKTQPSNNPVISGGNPIFDFDIQDACQEFLIKQLPANGQATIVNTNGVMASVFCKFRISDIDIDGFTVIEGPAPKQGTVTKLPTAGAGTQSNAFYVLNATLQHQDNMSLKDHLNSYKRGTWDNYTFPLTHRPNNYRICKGDSDVFPIAYVGPNAISCIKLSYRNKGSNTFTTVTNCVVIPPPTCNISVNLSSFEIDSSPGNPPQYMYGFSLDGTEFQDFDIQVSLNADKSAPYLPTIVTDTPGVLEYTIDLDTVTNPHWLILIPQCTNGAAAPAFYWYYSKDYSEVFIPVDITNNSFGITQGFTEGVTWDLSIDGGLTYIATGLTSSSTYTVTGLLPNTTYQVVRRMHSLNGIIQALPAQPITTLT